ncbi:transglycosylase SLT domain-containing protein [Novosphingobium colocasiae]|uniref:transglycosylase SLT domain-containing protein n=1 Tax=Novosphingobium colocasiae TaxID=1256513 RepID=UPI0035B182D1
MDPHGAAEMSVADTLDFDEGRVRAAPGADTRPPSAWYTFNWDATKAAAADAAADVPGRARDARNADILSAAAELTRLNGKSMSAYMIIPMGGEAGVPIALEGAFWNDLAQVRRTRPDALKDFASDKADYDRKLTARFQQGAADRAERMSRNGLLGNLAGGIAGSFTDPFNLATLPVGGGGRSVATRIVTEGLANAGVELAEQPLIATERSQQGRDYSLREGAWNVALAGLGGAGFKALEIGAPKAFAAAGRGAAKAGTAALEKLPLDVQTAIRLRGAKPDFALTPDEAAALHVIQRGAEVDATHPFAQTYEGLDAHAQRVNATIAAMARWPQPGDVPAMPVPGRLGALAGKAIATDVESAWRAIVGIEGGTNRDGSFRTSPAGAIGPAQVMPATGPEAARLAGLPWDEGRFRSDHAYNEALGRAYYQDMLRQFDGDPVKAAAAYNAGPGSARKGTGVRGAMARAARAGVPDEWTSFLPAETRGYVANFIRRTGMDGDVRLALGEDGDIPARPAALDAQRPAVAMPELDPAGFRSEAEWRRAQGELDAESLGGDPHAARQAVWIEARDRLTAAQGGEVPGALWHPAIGAIDVKWGDAEAGLAKIAQRHPEVLDDLPAIIADMDVVDRQRPGRVTLESGDHSAVVRLDWDGQAQSWLLTAFRREDPRLRSEGKVAPSPADNMRAGDRAGASPTAGAMRDIALARAGVQMGPGVGDFGRWWEGERARTGRARPVHAIVDGKGRVRGWESTPPRARRQLERMALADARVIEMKPPTAREIADHPALRDEIDAEGGNAPAVPDREAGAVFDDPRGDRVGQVADLAWHDAQMAAATRQAPEQLTFDLGDGKGERTMAQIEAELKADEDAIATIEGCLAPAPKGDAA